MTKKYIILRTSWVFSEDGKNFVNTILRLAKERDELKVVSDQFGGPTSADCIAGVLLKLATEHKEHWGIYHYSGQPFMSWYAFAKKIIEQAVKDGLLIKAPEIMPCSSDEFPVNAKRPKNSQLSSKKIASSFGLSVCDWTQ